MRAQQAFRTGFARGEEVADLQPGVGVGAAHEAAADDGDVEGVWT